MDLLTPDIGLLFWMTLSFLIVLFILRVFAWKPILQALKNRETSIDEALSSAEKAREEMQRLQADNKRIIDDAKKERDEIMREAREMKEQIIKEAKEQAGREADKLIESARTSIESEKAQAINEIKSNVISLSVEIAEKILGKELKETDEHEELVDSLLRNINLN